MGKGYGEGPAAEERFAALERGEGFDAGGEREERQAVYASTPDNPEKHFIGWLGEVDPEELFASGDAWGISIVRRAGDWTSLDRGMGVPRKGERPTPFEVGRGPSQSLRMILIAPSSFAWKVL